jgi:uncharacterized tellurite resistance protein B-like protein
MVALFFVDPLAWLGLREAEQTNLSAIQTVIRAELPDDESVVIRYLVIVSVLLTRVAYADGRFANCERDLIKGLFRHIDRLPRDGIDEVCKTLGERVPELTSSDLKLCFQELKSLCDAKERRGVMRLLVSLAAVDGTVLPAERDEMLAIAGNLNIPQDVVEQLVSAVRQGPLEQYPLPARATGRPGPPD